MGSKPSSCWRKDDAASPGVATLKLPANIGIKKLADRRVAYYWEVPTKVRRAGCRWANEALGREPVRAIVRADELNPALHEWRHQGEAPAGYKRGRAQRVWWRWSYGRDRFWHHMGRQSPYQRLHTVNDLAPIPPHDNVLFATGPRTPPQKRRSAVQTMEATTQLVGALNHDLRQPLQSVLLFSAVVARDPNLSPQSVAALGHLQTAVGHMGQLLETILTLARLEAAVPVQKKLVPLAPLLTALYEQMSPQAAAKDLDLRLVAVDARVQSDATLLLTMVRNLVCNAIRYTDHGKILIGGWRRAGHVTIGVYDTGPGIAESDLGRIFEEFQQLENATGTHHQGLGLGLSIVDRLGQLLEHRVAVRSTLGKGSAFFITMAEADGPRPPSDAA